jgi:RNA polymerase sigma factor (sigma-70 family)
MRLAILFYLAQIQNADRHCQAQRDRQAAPRHGETEMYEDSASGFTGQATTSTVHAGPLVIDLVTRARMGDKQSWDALVERYAPLIWSICSKYRLGRAEAEDVGQSVWLRLVGQLDKVRSPAALPGWLAITTRRECWRVLRAARGPRAPANGLDAENLPDEQAADAEQDLLEAERCTALREALTHLPPGDQRLIALLIADPPLPYIEISARLGIPVGSIGPSRSRCLAKIRRYPTIAAVNGQVFVPAGGQVKVSTPRVDQVLFRVVPPLALAWRMR